ncbi:MAG: glycerol-3-phosphate 1-O-acyltransferase PlsY [Lachnospiraceae bacterium]|nr:glycerol-3-phosphate 1-O-acyltransferase PlsY [Lachnospiraceae bacterium]
MLILERVLSLAIGYFCGCFVTGYFYGKSKQVDIRTMGSGNAGTTNTLRNLGWKAGIITFLGDCFKCVLAILLVHFIFRNDKAEMLKLLELYAGLGTILGHNFPFYLGFKGGKGIACTAGVLVAFCPFEIPVCLGVFVAAVLLTRYVSVGSILVVISFFVQTVIFGQMGWFHMEPQYLMELYILSAVITGMAIFRHRSNIKRLLNGTENKFKMSKKEA